MMRGLLLLGAALAVAACERPAPPTPLSEQVIYPNGTAELNAARQEALKTLPVFWSKFYGKPVDVSDFAVKVEFAVPEGGSEGIWGEPIRQTSDEVVVRLLNDGDRLPDLKFGAEVRAPLSKIWDWTYTKDGKMYGHFTTRVLLKEATPEQRAQAEGMFSPTPLEAEAR